MNISAIKKIGILIVAVILVRLFVVYTFDYVNEKNTIYIEMENKMVSSEEVVRGVSKSLIPEENDDEKGRYTFYLEDSNKEELSIIYDGSQVTYSIYVNDDLKVQNYDQSIAGYTDRVAYYSFDIEESDYRSSREFELVKIELRRYKDPMKNPVFYLGEKEMIRQLVDIRTIYNTAMILGFLIMLILSLFFYYRDQALYMLITLWISIVSFLKSIISGEVYAFSHLLNISGQNYFFYDNLTSVLNLFLYYCLIYILYDFKVKKAYIFTYMAVYSALSIKFVFGGDLRVYLLLIIIGDLVTIVFAIAGYLKSKPYSINLLIAYNIFTGFNIYTIVNRLNIMKQGHLSSIAFGPQIGSFIFILVFLVAVIGTYFEKMKAYEQQQIEYERVTLLRGISHDLKLPLSVIQLNNQMIGRYEMASAERADYIESSQEAIQDLREMTDNINCYLNMDSPVQGENRTSIRDGFIKLKNHSRSRAHNQEVLKVHLDENDYLLPIDPLEFERMLYNLVDNAFKYNRENGDVEISYSISEKVIIIVEDKGVGIEAEEIKRIFEPFYKTDISRSSEGFGLGLSVVKGVVNKLRGEIQVESKVGSGTKISIIIPK